MHANNALVIAFLVATAGASFMWLELFPASQCMCIQAQIST